MNPARIFFLFFGILWILSGSAGALDKDVPASLPDGAVMVHWHENGVHREAWAAPDEVAVFRGPAPGRAATLDFQRDVTVIAAAEDVLHMTPFVAVIRSPLAPTVRGGRDAMEGFSRHAGSPRMRPVSPVFYPQAERIPATRMALTGELSVRFNAEPDPDLLQWVEKQFDLLLIRSASFVEQMYVFQASTPWLALERANALQAFDLVREASPVWYRARTTRLSNDPLSGQQWHLANTGQGGGVPGVDANVVPAWTFYRGSHEQVIAVVDDGLEVLHEDLRDNVIPGLSWDWVENKDDPSGLAGDRHGTAVGGVAAARGFNQIGVAGVAPLAGLAGMRVLGAETDLNEAEALSRNADVIAIYNNSWGPIDDGRRLEAPGPLTRAALEHGVATGRGGKGSIFVWAGGNGRLDNDNSNYDGYANSREVLAVAASTDHGVRSWYSEPGANILVNAPSNGGTSGVTTTDRMGFPGYSSGNYTSSFGGTSSAAPLVAGVVALMLQANPELTWRDVRWILADTARRNDIHDVGWARNGARRFVHHDYGFGRVDAWAAVNRSRTWPGLPEEVNAEAGMVVNEPIPDNNAQGVISFIQIDEDFIVEFVEIFFSAADHTYWGDLEIVLTSPAGTRSVLAERHASGRNHRYDNWRFGSTRHLGEGSAGNWTLTVRDQAAKDTGTFEEWTLVVYGHVRPDPVPVNLIPQVLMLLLDDAP